VSSLRPLALALLCALCGCTVGPDFVRPEPPPASSYASKGDAPAPSDQRIHLGEGIKGDWWTAFHSYPLSDVINVALAGNQDVAVGRARMAEAEEEVNAAEGALLPQVSLGATAGQQKYGRSLFGPLSLTIPPFAYYTVGPTVTFPLDLFGGERRTVEEKEAFLDYQRYELQATYQSLTAHVAAEALALAAARAQIETLNGIIADDQRNVDLVQSAITAGSATRVQLMSAQSQLASDRTLLPDFHQQESVARHALAILVGKAPAEWAPPDFALTDFYLPQEIPVSLPSDLVHRRPDILAAEAQLHLASAAIGVATANLYPKIDLVGTVTQQALSPGLLFNSVANAWSIAANLSQPLFDGGQLSAERRGAIDNYHATLAIYRQTILGAFADVADQLQALSNDADTLRAQGDAERTASVALDLARQSYAVGNSGILDVIDAERRLAQARQGLARATAQRLLDTAQLYLALGGAPVAPNVFPTKDIGKGQQGSSP
jgi:NodT family efflux transporter outer membrane factor (OMF) lipoprotein